MKRCFDLFFSISGLVFLSPLFLIVAVLIKLDSRGHIFFKQERVGKNFKTFNIYKFRTMVEDAQKKGLSITSGYDKRITRFGKFLRKTKIDELPQLINVVKGEMSLVGPRPEVKKYVDFYMVDYMKILKLRPGITDISSLKYRDEEALLKEHNDPEEYYVQIHLPNKIALAKEYIKKTSLVYDLKLIFLTFKRIFYYSQEK